MTSSQVSSVSSPLVIRNEAAWRSWNQLLFPGTLISNCRFNGEGRIDSIELGAGSLFFLRMPDGFTFTTEFSPTQKSETAVFALQLKGSTWLRYGGETAQIAPGHLYVGRPPGLRTDVSYQGNIQQVLLRLPWEVLAARHPHLAASRVYNPEEPGVRLLIEFLCGAASEMHAFTPRQRSTLLATFVQLAGLPSANGCCPHSRDPRVERVMRIIEAELHDPTLDPSTLSRSQRVSRRRLDQLFVKGIGLTVARYVGEQRLQRAYDLLRDPRNHLVSITQIAFSVGFLDSAHFSRSFRARFGLPPRAVRSKDVGSEQEYA